MRRYLIPLVLGCVVLAFSVGLMITSHISLDTWSEAQQRHSKLFLMNPTAALIVTGVENTLEKTTSPAPIQDSTAEPAAKQDKTKYKSTTRVQGTGPAGPGTTQGQAAEPARRRNMFDFSWQTLLWIIGGGLMLTAIYFLVRDGKMASRRPAPMGVAPAQAAPLDEAQVPGVAFSDVAGCEEAVEEVQELVAFLRNPEPFQKLGARMPSGVILHGPPGTGKTLLAKALAGESGVPFFAASGSEFVEMYVGVGARRVRDLFARARKCETGAVMFIDEIDAVGGKRSDGPNGSHRESDQTLNQLLAEMDGFGDNARVVVVAATNRLDMLDDALTRPGRFSRHIEVQLPDRRGREEILRVHATDRPLAEDVDLRALAEMTAGTSGAQLAETLNEAAIWAARHGHEAITHQDVFEGLCRVIAGPRRQRLPEDEDQLRTVAIHEAGHALCAELCETHPPTQHLTVQPRGRALGFALQGRTDRALIDEQELHERLMGILGGRAAEYVLLGKVSSGAANDLWQATDLARRGIEEWGLSAQLGQISRAGGGLAEATRAGADREVARLVDEAYDDAVKLLTDHQDALQELSQALLEQETLSRAELDQLVGHYAKVAHQPQQAHEPRRS